MLLRERCRLAVLVAVVTAVAPLAFATGVAAAAGGSGGSEPVVATLKITSPKVEVKRQGASAFKVAKDGAKLREGDTVRTDASGLAEIDYGNDAYTRLDVSTEFTITKLTDEQGARQVQGSLEVGQTWNRTAAITESGSFEQEGAGANAAVRGTAFAVSCDAPDHCTFIAIEHTTALTGTDGVTKDLTPRVACDSTDGDLCDAMRTLSVDELAANDWIQSNLIRDLNERGVGDGPFVPDTGLTGTLVIVDGKVISFTPDPPSETPPPPPPPDPVCGTGADLGIVFDAGNGTGAASGTLGTCATTPFGTDPQPNSTPVTSVAAPGGGAVTFGQTVDHRIVGSGWSTWSHGYAGDVYFAQNIMTLTISLPPGTLAFSFFAEPNAFANFAVTATANSGTTSGPVTVAGNSGATNFGFYATSEDEPLTSITVTCTDSSGFAIGEFAISQTAVAAEAPNPVSATVEDPAPDAAPVPIDEPALTA